MYEAFYGLNGKPFNLTPDPRFLYLSQKHKEAFAHLVYGVQNRSGFVMITGEIGTGKTTICRSLLSQLDEDTELAFIFNPILSRVELLRKINEEFGIDTQADSVKALIDELNEYLLDCAARGKNCVLVIDEAQNLDPKLLEQIRLLSNLETETQKLLQILLIGQPELVEKLNLPELRQLNQRITARYHLKGLDPNETKQYIAFRLRVAGGLRKVRFTRGAVRVVYNVSGGTPRVINAICDRALLIGYTQESHEITPKIVRRAAREIQGAKIKALKRRKTMRMLPRSALAGGLAVVLVGAFLLTGKSPAARWDSIAEAFEHTWTRLAPAAERPDRVRVVDASVPEGFETHPDHSRQARSAEPLPEAPPQKAGDKQGDTERQSASGEPRTLDSAERPEDGPNADTTAATANWPDRLDPKAALHNALAALLEAWDVPADSAYPDTVSDNAIAQFATANGLSFSLIEPTLDQLLTLNLPALTQIESPTGQVWVAFLGVQPDTFHLSGSDGQSQSVDRELFARHYAKKAVLLWRDPAPGAGAVQPWTSGPAVEAMQRSLVDLGLLDDADGVYDRETIEAVKRIQRATGLVVDGIVGPQTRLPLAHWQSTPPMPTLAGEPFTQQTRDRVLGVVPSETDEGDENAQVAADGATEQATWSASVKNAPVTPSRPPNRPGAHINNASLPEWIRLPATIEDDMPKDDWNPDRVHMEPLDDISSGTLAARLQER